jgi:small multidrug resistance pump
MRVTEGLMRDPRDEALAWARPWLYGAAVYNLAWGALNVLVPTALFDLFGMRHPTYTLLWQVVGMLVGVYAPAYWWAARAPFGHRHLVLLGLAGKVLGPAGFLVAASSGALPWAFGLTILTNDLVWWPAFALHVRKAAHLSGGYRQLLLGE